MTPLEVPSQGLSRALIGRVVGQPKRSLGITNLVCQYTFVALFLYLQAAGLLRPFSPLKIALILDLFLLGICF